jgi:ABC-type siderophore export system fused ATPase/permease subunit
VRPGKSGATVLAVAHDTRLVPYANRVFHLVDGRLAEAAPYEPLHEVASFA